MNNVRGNSYSKKHLNLESCVGCAQYWNFSHHESALEDYSASIFVHKAYPMNINSHSLHSIKNIRLKITTPLTYTFFEYLA